MRVLVACEYSGVVRSAFRKLGHDAWSCDILPADDGSPYHFQSDVLDVLELKNQWGEGWDLMIAHPPCTYLSRAGARWLYPKGELNDERYGKLLEGKKFFMDLMNADIPKIAIENPTPFKVAELPPYSQVVQPYGFGDPYTKRTLLWLKGLPVLTNTNEVDPQGSWLPSNTSGFRKGQKSSKGVAKNASLYSRTFQGIADAMADQWGSE